MRKDPMVSGIGREAMSERETVSERKTVSTCMCETGLAVVDNERLTMRKAQN